MIATTVDVHEAQTRWLELLGLVMEGGAGYSSGETGHAAGADHR